MSVFINDAHRVDVDVPCHFRTDQGYSCHSESLQIRHHVPQKISGKFFSVTLKIDHKVP